MIFGHDTSERQDCSRALVHSLYVCIEHAGMIPQTVLVNDNRIRAVLEPTASALGIIIQTVDQVQVLETAMEMMAEQQFSGKNIDFFKMLGG